MLKLIAMWFSLCVLLLLFLGGIPLLIVKQFPEDALKRTMSFTEILISCLAGLPALVLLVYGGFSVWLLIWRHFSTYAEIMQIVGSMRPGTLKLETGVVAMQLKAIRIPADAAIEFRMLLLRQTEEPGK